MADAHTYLDHTDSDMIFDTLKMQSTSYLLRLCGIERCYPLAGCPACKPNGSMGFAVLEARLVTTIVSD